MSVSADEFKAMLAEAGLPGATVTEESALVGRHRRVLVVRVGAGASIEALCEHGLPMEDVAHAVRWTKALANNFHDTGALALGLPTAAEAHALLAAAQQACEALRFWREYEDRYRRACVTKADAALAALDGVLR